MTPDEATAFLESQKIGVLGTISPHGDPHLVNVAYLVEPDGRLVFTSFRAAQKVKNLERAGRASFLVEVVWPYSEIQGVMMSGPVEIVDDADTVFHLMTRTKDKHADMSGDEGTPDIDARRHSYKRVAVYLEPEKLRSWDHHKLGGTY